MARRKATLINPLVFIDTNIYLDCYRMRDNDIRMQYMKKIESIGSNLILTSQVEMEYKKNRHNAIQESIKSIGCKDNANIPVFVSDFKPAKKISDYYAEIKKQYERVNEKIIRTLDNPMTNDAVYQCIQRLFRIVSPLRLERESDVFEEIYGLASKRFSLGYPPRKKDDTSFGDSINWEWIIRCATTDSSQRDVVIVTRDTDYGLVHKNTVYINDWLAQEFKQRVSQKRKIVISRSLSTTLKIFDLQVSRQMVEEEKLLINADAQSIDKGEILPS